MKTKVSEVMRVIEAQRYHSLAEAKEIIPADARGFYWIYTKLGLSKLQECEPPSNSAHINVAELSSIHDGLAGVTSQIANNFWCVYNGKGGPLRNRIVAEFSNTQGPTGTIALTRCFSESDFAVKFILCDSSDESYGILDTYELLSAHLERAWRLEFGWPILCRA